MANYGKNNPNLIKIVLDLVQIIQNMTMTDRHLDISSSAVLGREWEVFMYSFPFTFKSVCVCVCVCIACMCCVCVCACMRECVYVPYILYIKLTKI